MKYHRVPEDFIPANKLLEQFYYAAKILDVDELVFESYNVHYVEREFHPDVVGVTYLRHDDLSVYPHGEAIRLHDLRDLSRLDTHRYLGTFTTLFPPFWHYVSAYATRLSDIKIERVLGAIEAAQHYVERIHERNSTPSGQAGPEPGVRMA